MRSRSPTRCGRRPATDRRDPLRQNRQERIRSCSTDAFSLSGLARRDPALRRAQRRHGRGGGRAKEFRVGYQKGSAILVIAKQQRGAREAAEGARRRERQMGRVPVRPAAAGGAGRRRGRHRRRSATRRRSSRRPPAPTSSTSPARRPSALGDPRPEGFADPAASPTSRARRSRSPRDRARTISRSRRWRKARPLLRRHRAGLSRARRRGRRLRAPAASTPGRSGIPTSPSPRTSTMRASWSTRPTTALTSNSFYLANKDFAQNHPDVLKAVLDELAGVTRLGGRQPRPAGADLVGGHRRRPARRRRSPSKPLRHRPAADQRRGRRQAAGDRRHLRRARPDPQQDQRPRHRLDRADQLTARLH